MRELKKNTIRIKTEKGKSTILITTFVIIVAAIAYPYIFMMGFVFFGVRESHQMRVRLLCQTDHKALLESCREILKQSVREELKSGQYSVRMDPSPEVLYFPKPILELDPAYIYIDENDKGCIVLAMAGGLDHFGLIAYSEDYKPSQSDFQYGDRELIPDLWYYDEGYSEYSKGPSKYDEIIDSVIKTGKWPKITDK